MEDALTNRHEYDDIIDKKRPASKTHPPMAVADRAAQFSPFAALSGYEEAIRETERRTEEKKELDESEKELLNRKLEELQAQPGSHPEVELIHFVKDARKDGGSYERKRGILKKIDPYEKKLVFTDQSEVEIENIMEII